MIEKNSGAQGGGEAPEFGEKIFKALFERF